MRHFLVLVALLLAAVLVRETSAAPLAETFLLEGRLTEGEKALREHLQTHPADDEARFGLGTVQFLLAFEHLGGSLYEHGLRTERAFPGLSRQLAGLLPQNPSPKELTYQEMRQVIQTFLGDLEKAESTLAAIQDKDVKLPLHVGLIKVDLFGLGKPINAAFVLGRMDGAPAEAVESFVIGFDRGDVHWLRGYCHFLCACSEVMLSVDSHEMFDCTAHLFFEKTATPHKFLLEEDRNFERVGWWNARLFSDVIAFIHLMRFPMEEPQRMQAALAHLEGTVAQSREMWKHYQAEEDDDHEWIPNPRQTGVLQVKVTQEMITTWLDTVDETEQVLAGKKLIPFWRGENARRGVNLRRVFTEPRQLDPILWVQGTAVTPFLEEGEITELAGIGSLRRISNTFGGMNFFGFAFWFN
ncbi:tetratricopeptide repeat protein [Lignipirellula cremea]|uniref:Tetratricopeptide repeat protein n=1 Tax=Lignipirellula cremea TaxID=2528010 RepID=A0A518DLE5_9BACT|nr:hypothetical protein [Lignipirellula cremea]QDU92664.1 hypothetical protein Pla8534_04120 [Lignipirellula cremea]